MACLPATHRPTFKILIRERRHFARQLTQLLEQSRLPQAQDLAGRVLVRQIIVVTKAVIEGLLDALPVIRGQRQLGDGLLVQQAQRRPDTVPRARLEVPGTSSSRKRRCEQRTQHSQARAHRCS